MTTTQGYNIKFRNDATFTNAVTFQNTGNLELTRDNLGVNVNGTGSTITQTQLLDNSSVWVSGEVAELYVCPTGITMTAGQEIIVTVVVQSEPYQGISGQHSFSEVIRLV